MRLPHRCLRRDRTVPRDLQMPDHLRRSCLRLGTGRGLPVQHRPGRALGVEAVRFSMKVAQLAIGTHDIQNRVPLGQQSSGQARAIRAGPLDAEGFDLTEPGGPSFELMVALLRRGDGRAAQTCAVRIDGNGNVVGFVRVYADDHVIHVRPFCWNGPGSDRRGQDCHGTLTVRLL